MKKKEYKYTTDTLGAPDKTYNYMYGNAYKDLLTSYDGKDITYDGTGRPVSYKGNQLVWAAGNLYSYGDTTFNYLYDNSRIYKNWNGATVYYHYQSDKLLLIL